jgi:hypothetical protein
MRTFEEDFGGLVTNARQHSILQRQIMSLSIISILTRHVATVDNKRVDKTYIVVDNNIGFHSLSMSLAERFYP